MTPNEPIDVTDTAVSCRHLSDEIRRGLGRNMILRPEIAEQSLVGLLAGGHILLEGHPGMGKRTLAHSLAQLAGLSFAAIGCTRDMEPADLTGAEELREDSETGRRSYQFLHGPLFANLVYVEDLHLAPPKSSAVLIDSMRRSQVGHGQHVRDLPSPFTLIATIAPELDDTELAPEASVTDRFLLQISFDYPSETDEWEIGRRVRAGPIVGSQTVISAKRLAELQQAAAAVEVPDDVLGYAWALVRATRPGNDLAPDFVEKWIDLGISPQGLVALVSAAKARALLRGRASCTRRDVYEITPPVFQHRLRGNEETRAAGLTVDRLIRMLLERIPLDSELQPPRSESSSS